MCRVAGVTRRVAFELGEIREMVKFAASGLGATIVPRSFTIGPDCGFIEELGASVIEIQHPCAAFSIGVFFDAHRSSATVRSFLQMLDDSASVSVA
jgi:DNA-binding transcriptional LysR family regulator